MNKKKEVKKIAFILLSGGRKISTNIKKEVKNMFCPIAKISCQSEIKLEIRRKCSGDEKGKLEKSDPDCCIFYSISEEECILRSIAVFGVNFLTKKLGLWKG